MQTDLSTQDISAPARPHRPVLPDAVAFGVLGSILISFLAGSSAPTPLYASYQAEWRFSPITTTVVFGTYAAAVLVALLVVGRLSDHVGRRPVLLVAIAGQIGAMAVFATAGGVGALLVARVLGGLAAGAAIAAVGAALLDLDAARGALANAALPGLGTGGGALVSALVVQFLPAPSRLIYVVIAVVLLVQAVGVWFLRETRPAQPGALSSLRPAVAVPRQARAAMVAAAPVLFAVWALAGFFGSLGPALLRQLSGSRSTVVGSLGLFVLAVVATVSVLLARNLTAHRMALLGVGALLAGMAGTLVAVSLSVLPLLLASIAVSGIGFGAGFQGGLRTVLGRADASDRASVLAALLVVCYLGFGLPAVIAGYLVVHGGGLAVTAREYAAAVIVLALLTLIGLLRGHRVAAAGGPDRASE